MLRRLGRRLALVNMLVSGAILVTMALLALSVAEGMIGKQYEADLSMYARSAVAISRRVDSAGNVVHYNVPERYMVYFEGKDGETVTVGGAVADIQTVEAAAQVAKETLTLEEVTLPARLTDTAGLYDAEATVGETFPRHSMGEFAPDQEGSLNVRMGVSSTPYLITNTDGEPLRVAATMLDAGEMGGLMLVVQDRADEIAARVRMRWLFGGCVALGLGLIFLASVYLSNRSIRPIETSIRQQREFVAAASHELRTPVAALRANAEVLKDANLGEYAPYLESITSVSERMSLLISDLMDLARADAGELSMRHVPVDVDAVAGAAIQWMRPLMEKKQITLSVDVAPAVILGDSDRLRQALLALLDNALAYTPPGGQVTVSVRKEAKTVRVSVSDTGPGIPDEHKAHVFDRFYRVDKARSRAEGGFGLGLSVVKQLAEQMEGSVALLDGETPGAAFELRFKAVE